jgi:hypothetical protein
MDSKDKILSMLSYNLINRKTFKVEVHDEEVDENYIHDLRLKLSEKFQISYDETEYLYGLDTIKTNMYDIENDNIKVYMKDNSIRDICEVSELLNVALLIRQKPKYYIIYQRL